MLNRNEIYQRLIDIRQELDGKVEKSVIQKLDKIIETLDGTKSSEIEHTSFVGLDLILKNLPAINELLKILRQFIE